MVGRVVADLRGTGGEDAQLASLQCYADDLERALVRSWRAKAIVASQRKAVLLCTRPGTVDANAEWIGNVHITTHARAYWSRSRHG